MSGVRVRLFGSFALCLVFMVALGAVGALGVQSLHRQGQVVGGQTTPYLMHLADAAVAAKAAANDERGFLLTHTPSYVTEFDGRIPTVTAALAAATEAAADAEQRSAVADAATGFVGWVDLVHGEFTLVPSDPDKATTLALGVNRDARKAYESSLVVATKLAQDALVASITAQDLTAGNAQRNLFIMLVVGASAAAAIGTRIVRQVTVPLANMQTLLTGAAAGDLTGRANHLSRDEFGALGSAYNTMVDSVSGALATIAKNAGNLAGATEELTVFSNQINASAQESSAQALVVAAAA